MPLFVIAYAVLNLWLDTDTTIHHWTAIAYGASEAVYRVARYMLRPTC